MVILPKGDEEAFLYRIFAIYQNVRSSEETDMTDDCVFCKIVSGEFGASVVAEDGYAVALMDKNPIHGGHVLSISLRQTAQLSDLSEDEAAEIFRFVYRVACAFPKSGVRCAISYLPGSSTPPLAGFFLYLK